MNNWRKVSHYRSQSEKLCQKLSMQKSTENCVLSTFYDVEDTQQARKSVTNLLSGRTRQEEALRKAFWTPSGRQKEPKGSQVGAFRASGGVQRPDERHAKMHLNFKLFWVTVLTLLGCSLGGVRSRA